jgi:hypothetical protein
MHATLKVVIIELGAGMLVGVFSDIYAKPSPIATGKVLGKS